jgi:hypothetical protein
MRPIVADIVSKVNRKRRSKVSRGPCIEERAVVKNFAAEQMEIVKNLPASQDDWARPAPKPARSSSSDWKVELRFISPRQQSTQTRLLAPHHTEPLIPLRHVNNSQQKTI